MPTIQESNIPFPEAPEGHERFVIGLPSYNETAELSHLQVQIIVGKYEAGDDGDRYVYRGTLQEQDLQGWGYTYWVAQVEGLVATRSTPLAQHKDNFIPLVDCPVTRYNSKLPVVVYVPDGFEVHYKVWSDETGRKVLDSEGGQEQQRSRAAPAAAQDASHDDWEGHQGYPTEDANTAVGGDDQYPTEDPPAAYQQAATYEEEQPQHQYRELAPENEPQQDSVVPLSAQEGEAPEEQPPTYSTQAREVVDEYQDRANENYERLRSEQETYVRDADAQASALRATEEERVEQAREQAQAYIQERQASVEEQVQSSKKAARAKASELQTEALQAQRNAVMPLSSTEMSPGKAKNARTSNASPKRSSSSTNRDTDNTSSSGTTKNKTSSSTKRNSDSVSPSKKKRGSLISPRKSYDTNSDKYKEL